MRHASSRHPSRLTPLHHGAMCLLAAGLSWGGCASAPPAVKGPTTTLDQKMAWMLELEDRRVLRLEPPPAPPAPVRKGRAAPTPPAAPVPDLAALAADPEARVRRRAALAIGRAGLPEGVAPLTTALADQDPEVRAMAAFGLGLIGDASAAQALVGALADASPIVRGRAAEALGTVGSKDGVEAATARSFADPIASMAAEYGRTPVVRGMGPDDETWPAAPEAEAFRLGVYALVRLKAYDGLAAAALEGGRPVSAWWPVAYAFGRIGDPRAEGPLLQMMAGQGTYGPAFAARGLGNLKARAAVAPLVALAARAQSPQEVRISAIRGLAALGDASAGAPLARLLDGAAAEPNLRLELVTALGALKAPEALDQVQDLLSDPWPAMRSAALRATAAIDPENFVLVLAGMDPDPDWTVRATLVDVLASLPPAAAVERVRSMAHDTDRRVMPAVLSALVRLKDPEAPALALAQLKEPDYAVRAAAARVVGELKPAGGADALRAAWTLALADAAMDARASILSALAAYGAADATPALREALGDKDWALRLHAAALLQKLDPQAGDPRAAIRPAPGAPIVPYDSRELIAPSTSPHVFIETARGTIEFELAVLDAPQTVASFVSLASRGFFNGLQIHRVVPNFVVQAGDPRGDGEGGPGYTIRDELNDRPFVRGTVGMALSGRDTGGSQFFITHSPQPHLDGRYTVFGHVVNGMDVVDRIQQWDVIQRVRVWDGMTMR